MSGNGSGNGNGARTADLREAKPLEPGEVTQDAPATEVFGAHFVDDERKVGPLRQFFREVRNYGLLRKTPYGILPALILGFMIFFGQLDGRAFRIAGPVIARELEIQIGDVINIQVMVGVVSIFATILVGYAADRVRRVPFVAFGNILSGISAIVLGRATSFATVAAPRVAGDVATAAGDVPNFSLLADYYPPESRGRVFAMLGTFSRVGRVLGVFAAGVLLLNYGFRTTFLVVGVPLIVMGILALIFLREPVRGYMERRAMGADEETARQEDEPQSLAESWRTTFGVRTIRRLVVASSIGLVGDAFVGLFLPFFLFDEYGLNEFEAAMVLLPAAVAALIGGIYGGGLIDRFTRKNPSRVLTILAVYSIIAASGVLIYVFTPPLFVVVAANAVFDFGAALIGPARNVIFANVIPPSIRTTGLQITALSALPGLIFASTIAGTLFALYGYDAVFLAAVPFLVIDGLIALTASSFYNLDMRAAQAAAMADEEWRRSRASGNAKLLVARDVNVDYDGVQVLFGVDFDVEEGDVIALLGTNGAGKSTLLRAISGLRQASGGAVVFDGRDITHMPTNEIAGRGIVMMPGGRGIFPDLSVRENLVLANWLAEDEDDAKARMDEVMELFPVLAERADVAAGLLSGGEQQQVSLAQALLARPRLLLIDELSLGLAPTVVAQLIDIVKEIHRRGVSIVIVEQSVNVALEIADKAIFMEKGEVRFFGETAELMDRPDILRAVYVKGTAGVAAATRAAARGTGEAALGRNVLEVEELVKSFGGVNAVDHASFHLREGEVLGLIGPNGAGKTSIFDLVSGFEIPDSGSVVLDGVDITTMPPEERAKLGLIRRFQDASLFGSLTVFETLLIALEHHLEVRSTIMSAAAVPQARRAERRLHARAERLIDLLDLHAYRDKFVKELSTGLRRIVDLACVLGAEPKVLLLDEPSTGIAQAETENLGPLLRRAQHETGCSILIIEHDMALLSSVADELLALELGAVVTRGRPDEVLNDPRVIESYLGGNEAAIQRSGRT